MKYLLLLSICVLVMAAMAAAQYKLQLPPPDQKKNVPQITGSGGGSRKNGFDINLDARQRIYESANGRHSLDASAGYSQHLGGPYGNSPADRRVGLGYTYTFG